MNGSVCKMLLRLVNRASTYEHKKAEGRGGKIEFTELLVVKRLVLCSSFTPTIRERDAVGVAQSQEA